MARRRPPLSGRDERGIRARPVGVLPLRKRFLIVCEGAKTEPNYFRSFRLDKDVQAVVAGVGMNTESLVRRAMEIRDREHYRPFDEVWCVFDTDAFSSDQINAAFLLARANGIRVAYSNEAFELWYVLHFDYLDTGITRAQYVDRLNRVVPGGYRKNNPAMRATLGAIPGAERRAIRHARKLLETYPRFDPANNKPSTTVHTLVLELNKHAI